MITEPTSELEACTRRLSTQGPGYHPSGTPIEEWHLGAYANAKRSQREDGYDDFMVIGNQNLQMLPHQGRFERR